MLTPLDNSALVFPQRELDLGIRRGVYRGARDGEFLKLAPGLDKEVVGEYLGDPKDFQVEVLKEYADLFNFENVTLVKALRTFLDGFVSKVL